MRKVKCDRKTGSCWLEPAPLSQIGRGGGLVPIAVNYVISLRKPSSKRTLSGGGHKKKTKKKTSFSRSKVSCKRTANKKRKKNYGDFAI